MPINALHFFDRQPLLKITTHRTNIMLHASGAAAEIGLTYLVYFDHRFPLALALIPLIVAIALGTIWSRTTGMFSFLFWPVILSTIGLIGIELAAPLVWLGAGFTLMTLSGLAGITDLTGATLLLLFIPAFPASPLLPLVDLLKDLPHPLIFLIVIIVLAGLLEMQNLQRGSPDEKRNLRIAVIALVFVIVSIGQSLTHTAKATDSITEGHSYHWQETPAPLGLTPLTRWMKLRDQIPHNSTVILGENIFNAEETSALRFWCRTVAAQSLTLYIGVSEPYLTSRRSAIWKLDRQACSAFSFNSFETHEAAIVYAHYGIPWVTGTWALMPAKHPSVLDAGDHNRRLSKSNVLICLEAFLPWAWFRSILNSPPPNKHKNQNAKSMIIVANDTAFGQQAWMISVLRRKVATALMTFLNHSTHQFFQSIVFAEAERTFLIDMRSPS